jgi:hypothetical protein
LIKDPTFRINGFWLVIDENGKVKNIEKYIKHSEEIDEYVISVLKEYNWSKSMIKKHRKDPNEIYVEARTSFILKNQSQFGIIPVQLSED